MVVAAEEEDAAEDVADEEEGEEDAVDEEGIEIMESTTITIHHPVLRPYKIRMRRLLLTRGGINKTGR